MTLPPRPAYKNRTCSLGFGKGFMSLAVENLSCKSPAFTFRSFFFAY